MPTPGSPTTPPLISARPLTLAGGERGEPLQVKITAPIAGEHLPVVVFSHGFGGSHDGYAPLIESWAARGLVVIQPTHLDSRTLELPPDDARTPHIWRLRVSDLVHVIDRLEGLVAAVPGLAGRVDVRRIAVAGHSWGAQTAGMLLGARVLDAEGRSGDDLRDPRVTAGVLLAAAGTGDTLSAFAANNFPFMRPDFTGVTTSALVVAGDHDQSPLTTRGPDWFTDAYTLSPSPKSLLTLFGAEHSLGGISGYGVTETTDENPERVALVAALTGAYLATALGADDAAWSDAVQKVAQTDAIGAVSSK